MYKSDTLGLIMLSVELFSLNSFADSDCFDDEVVLHRTLFISLLAHSCEILNAGLLITNARFKIRNISQIRLDWHLFLFGRKQ